MSRDSIIAMDTLKTPITTKQVMGSLSYYKDGRYIKKKTAKELIFQDQEAKHLFKMAQIDYTTSYALGIAGGSLLGYTLGSYIVYKLNEEHASLYRRETFSITPVIPVAGIGLCAISTIMDIKAKKKYRKAVARYNETIAQKDKTISAHKRKTEFSLYTTSNELGFALKF